MKKFTLFLLMLSFAVIAFAVPADRSARSHKQSDGTTLIIKLNGDEYFHYYSTFDGVPVVKNSDGDYCYAVFDDANNLVSTGCIAHNKELRNYEEQAIIDANEFSGMPTTMKAVARARAAKAVEQRAASVSPKGVVNVAVVLVEYTDVKFTFSKELVSDVLNKKNYEGYQPTTSVKSIGSAKDYFIAQSGGAFEPNFIVTDIVTLPNKMAYYGENDKWGNDLRVGRMIADGLNAADANFDFSIFDNDGDGEAEFVYCIYAGFGESYAGNDENTVWPSSWELRYSVGYQTHDGVRFNTYACSSEIALYEDDAAIYGKSLSGIGLVCHEFSHCLGLPDVYDVNYNGGSTMHYWDLMDCGNYTADGYVPVGYNAYQRDFMGWKPLLPLEDKGEYSMLPLTSGGNGYKLVNEANSNEYFIFENRKQENWDSYLFGNGMLITHVDYDKTAWDSNELNTNLSHLRYKLIPADNEIIEFDGTNSAAAGTSFRGDVWPGATGNTAFTDTSLPAAKWNTGVAVGKPITDIKLENSVITFSFMRGVVDAPAVLAATDITDSGFTANWVAVNDAVEYTVELEKIAQVTDGAGDVAVLLEEDFVGCTKANESLKSLDNYLSTDGWTGSSLYGEAGVIRVGASSSAGSLKTPKLNKNGAVTVSFSVTNYNVSDTGSMLTVSAVGSNGVVIESTTIAATSSWVSKELEFNVAGDFYIEFSTINSTGKKRVKIDNIVVYYKSSYSTEIVDVVTVGATSYTFTGLEGGGVYRYRVSASDGYGSSAFSAYESVAILPTGISSIVAVEGGACEIYTIAGVLVYAGNANAIPALSRGVYVVKTTAGAKKIFVE